LHAVASLDYDPEKIRATRTEWNKQEHIKLYEETKKIADTLIMAATRIKQFKIEPTNAKQLHNIETAIYATLKSIKAIKNIHRDLIDLREAVDKETITLYDRFVNAQIEISRHIVSVEGEKETNYEHLILAIELLKKHHQSFIKEVS
jgi:hypothetical protein